MSNRSLTDKQKAFLTHLFDDECRGDMKMAKDKAGYASSVGVNELAMALADEIAERARACLGSNAAKAAFAMGDVMDSPAQIGAKEKMAAAEKILDRVGVVKEESINVRNDGNQGFVFLLPAKKQDEQEQE